MKIRRDVSLMPLDHDTVVFCEHSQCMLRLNAAAARLVRMLQDGMSIAEVTHKLTSDGVASREKAADWLSATLEALASHGMLGDGPVVVPADVQPVDGEVLSRLSAEMPPYVEFAPVAERRYRLLNICALVRFTHQAQLRLVESVIGHLAIDGEGASTTTIDIRGIELENGHLRSDIYHDKMPIGYVARLSELGPFVKGILWSAAINAHNFLFYIHAGVVATRETCLLLPAPSGSGKSSLTAALIHRGFRYFSDEVALIEPDTFKVPPVPLALCVKASGWDMIARYYPGLSSVPTHRRSDGKRVRYLAPPGVNNIHQRASAEVTHIIFPRHAKNGPTELKPLARSETLGRLMDECLALRQRLSHDNVRQLTRWIAGVDCYELAFASLDEGADLIEQTVKRYELSQV
jgi:hypothetical protein